MNKGSKNFALIGAAGYIAPRHMKAIKETGNSLVAALDKHDAVGIIDSFFPDADFFLEPERFDRHLDKLRRQGEKKIEYVSICSPNYLHDSHIRLALRNDANTICEKPLVLNPWNIEALDIIQKETGRKIYNILQLRLHDSIKELKEIISKGPKDKIHDVDLTYITSRGHWYHMSWKGDNSKSGGIATNIGIHFFDMLIWIFGDVQKNIVHYYSENKAAGFLELKNARVRWFLSIDSNDLPDCAKKANQRTYRSIEVDKKEIEFSEGFGDLHTSSYREILDGRGFGTNTAYPSINTVYEIRHAEPIGLKGDYHPILKKIL
ncbi:MAG TPA: Gfo/Idh/MocA family oxidoreductase [Bacteroidales bacterium]|nr:Gfo/Idh/MocA family oxidoreductase [Bacteroidales bacterium]HPS16842.1 Gfo/Idh/MocA family oxidoreductase [Bacteroidales bacterium]